jgi:hypothetical protein
LLLLDGQVAHLQPLVVPVPGDRLHVFYRGRIAQAEYNLSIASEDFVPFWENLLVSYHDECARAKQLFALKAHPVYLLDNEQLVPYAEVVAAMDA